MRVLARGSQSASWVLKSAGEANPRPGRNEVSKNPLLRSTIPLNSGSRGGASRTRVARVPANAAAGTLTRPVPPIADSRPQTSVFGTRPNCEINCHIPAKMSPAWRDGIIVADRNRENPTRSPAPADPRLPDRDRDRRFGEPQIALGDLAGLVDDPVDRVDPDVLRADPGQQLLQRALE